MYKTHPSCKDGKMLRNACFGIKAHSGPGYKVWLQEQDRRKHFQTIVLGLKLKVPVLLRPLSKVHVENVSLSSVVLIGTEITLLSPSAGGRGGLSNESIVQGSFN